MHGSLCSLAATILYPCALPSSRSSGSFRTTMERIRADLSEGELKNLEKRFAARSSSSNGNDGVAESTALGRAGGVRYVELLHWGARWREAGGGDDEVRVGVWTDLSRKVVSSRVP